MVNLKLVNSADLWYTIGLIVTDGNLSKDERHISITSKDRDLLVAVRKALNLECKLTLKGRGGESEKKYSVLQFSDVALYRYLESIGVYSKKSLTLGSINVPRKYFRDFLRGVIDGDGNIHSWVHKTNGHTQWCLRITSGAPDFSNWIHKKIQDQFLVTGKVYTYTFKGKKNPINIVKFGKVATKILLRNTYYQQCLSLERKYKKAQECLRDKNGWKKYGDMLTTPG